MRNIIISFLFLLSFSLQAATFKNLQNNEVESKQLSLFMKELSFLGKIEDTGVVAYKIFSKGDQSFDSMIRQNDYANGADESWASLVKANAPKNTPSLMAESFLDSLSRESDEEKRDQVKGKIISVLTKTFANNKLAIFEGGASFNNDAGFFVITILDITTLEMVQLYTGYAE